MKKLLFILSAILVSGITYGASLNPYAYNLSSTWNEETQELTVRFTLNAHPNMNQYKDANGNATNSCGIQIYAIDPVNPNDRYYIYGVSGAEITNHINANNYNYECTIPIDGMSKEGTVANRRPLPTGKSLTWAVQVCGLNNKNQSTPVVVNDEVSKRPYSCHGVAVNNDQNSPQFGNIYVTEASEGLTSTNSGNHWKWIADGEHGRSILQYSPRLDFEKSWKKDPQFSLVKNNDTGGGRVKNNLLEPHRVRVSENGRIFVSSYNIFTNTADNTDKPLVWELDTVSGAYTPIITFNHTNGYGHRVTGMAVKGSGDNLTIALCFLNITNGELRVYEYAIGNSTTATATATRLAGKYQLNAIYTSQSGVINSNWYSYSDGLISIAYGVKDKSRIYIGVDYFVSHSYYSVIVGLNPALSSDTKQAFTYSNDGYYYGGGGIAVYQYGNTDMVVFGRAYVSGSNHNGCFCVYQLTEDGNSVNKRYFTPTNIQTSNVTNDFAIDKAYNLYAVSFLHSKSYDGATSDTGTGRLIVIALPYDGYTTTVAPKGAAGTTFTLNPVPNILATDLTYAPYGNENKYEFSFNVNTKPELAQIRFYANEADMLANNNNYSFYYQFSEAERKQGRMSVIFDAVGGTVENKLLNDPNGNGLLNLPRGEYYWNVYVKTRKSCAFAPIYTQPAVGASDYHRQHATVDNNPNNKGFGHIYVADHHNIAESNNRVHYVRAYTIGNATGNAQQDNQSNINDNTRYTTYWQVQSNNKVRYTRRPIVSPDGMVYIADEGANQKTAKPEWFKDPNTSTYGFVGAGLHVLDPSKQTNNANAVWEANFSNPHGTTGNQEVTTGAYFLYKDGGWKLYRTNTYEEYTIHPKEDGTEYNYQNTKWINNGYRVYSITSTANGLVHSGYNDNQTTKRAFGAGDAGGQFSIVATEYGVWMCQHREKTVAEAPLVDGKPSLPDNKENIVLSFFDHSGNRKFTSYTYDSGNLTQQTSSPLQSTPGAGMAYQKRGGVEYLYVVNHAGNILEFEITGGATPKLTHTQTYVTGNGTKGAKYGAISSMNFDYAGNLVVTIGVTYGVNGTNVNGNAVVRDHQDLVIYTMPYPNQENARAIPASEAFRFLPERASYLSMEVEEVERLIKPYINNRQCALDFFRPLQGGMYNTICLPFDLNISNLPEGHPYKNASVKEFTRLNVTTIGNEKVLELVFTDVADGQMRAGVPYLFKTDDDIPGLVSFDDPIQFSTTEGSTVNQSENNSSESVTFQGIIASKTIDASPNHLIVVANNRLAEVSTQSKMFGFRGYFILNNIPSAQQVNAQLSFKRPVATAVGNASAEGIDVEKFIREGRIYIRLDDQVYDLTGARVQ